MQSNVLNPRDMEFNKSLVRRLPVVAKKVFLQCC